MMNKKPTDRWQALDPGVRERTWWSATTVRRSLGNASPRSGSKPDSWRARIAPTRKWRRPGFPAWKFLRAPFIRNGIAESFGEFVRRDEGPLAKIGLWPQQWAAARMFAQTAKGFHIHPPSVPAETSPNEWFQRLFVQEPENFSLRRYEEEQWDVMFFVQGRVGNDPARGAGRAARADDALLHRRR